MRKIKILIWLICTTGITSLSFGQHNAQFSQFYASPTLLSPSFTGLISGSRIALNYRDQWPNLAGTFVTYAMAYDQYVPSWRSGFGAIILRDVAGDGNLGSTNFGALYSFDFQANDYIHIRPGMHFLYTERGVDFNKLVFSDQIVPQGRMYNVVPGTIDPDVVNVDRIRYMDVTSSLLVYTNRFWGGFTWDHMLRPNQSLTGGVDRVNYRFSLYAGAKFDLNPYRAKYTEESLTVSALYKTKSKWKQMDIGVYYNKTPIILGLYFRGMPFQQERLYETYENLDAVVVLVGYKLYALSIGYSYDITISKLQGYTGGSHEISLVYEFNYDVRMKVKRRRAPVPCPKF